MPGMTARDLTIVSTRLIGLLLLGYSAAVLLGQVLPFLEFMSWISWQPGLVIENIQGARQIGFDPSRILLSLAGLPLGWYMLFRGQRIHGWFLAGLDGQCPSCSYNLRGVKGPKCPECGTTISD